MFNEHLVALTREEARNILHGFAALRLQNVPSLNLQLANVLQAVGWSYTTGWPDIFIYCKMFKDERLKQPCLSAAPHAALRPDREAEHAEGLQRACVEFLDHCPEG